MNTRNPYYSKILGRSTITCIERFKIVACTNVCIIHGVVNIHITQILDSPLSLDELLMCVIYKWCRYTRLPSVGLTDTM